MVRSRRRDLHSFGTSDLAGLLAYLGNLGPWGILATVDLLLALFIGLFWMVRERTPGAIRRCPSSSPRS